MNAHRLYDIVHVSRRAFGRYRMQIATLTGLGFASGILEGIGINTLIPLLSFVTNQVGVEYDIITRGVVRFFEFIHVEFNVTNLLIFIVLLFLGKAFFSLIFSFVRIKIDTDYEETTRNNLYRSVLSASWPYLLTQKVGYLDTMLMTDVIRGSVLLRQIGNIIMASTGLLVYSAVAVTISLPTTLITLALGGILFLLFRPIFARTRAYAARASEANKEVAHYVNESIVGMKTIKSLQSAPAALGRGEKFFAELRRLKMRTLFYISASTSLLQPVSLIFICLVFAAAYKTPGFNFAALIAIMYLIQRMFHYISQVHSNVHDASDAVPYVESLLSYQETTELAREKDAGAEPYAFTRSLALSSVSFSYGEGRPVLSSVSFSLKRGETVGLIGESGSGKTTIVDLLLRLFDPSGGEILLDGKDIRTIRLKEWRRRVGYVSQDIFLLNDTIANNIRFFDPSITDEDVTRAASMANIYEFVRTCKDGFETVVGERGIMLSAGQRQRIAIARVLARSPDILILDEATSALDNESEAKIQEVIDQLRGKVTVLIIAHRLSTVMSADMLLVLEKGTIVEEGKPGELLSDTRSRFYKMSTAHIK